MKEAILLGTTDGLLVFEVEGLSATLKTQILYGRYVSSLAATEGAVLASVLAAGLCRIDPRDWTATWTLDADVLSLASHPRWRNVCLAGTEPASLHLSDDGGLCWRELKALRQSPEAARWYHPSPTSRPHVLGLALDPEAPGIFYVGIEVGGVFKSEDGGASFRPMNQGLCEDIHQLAGHPLQPQVLFAVTGQGVFKSEDGAETWRLTGRGMSRRYAASVGIVTHPIEAVVVAAAQGPPRNAAFNANAVIFRSTSGGEGWETAMDGVPQSLDGVPIGFAASRVRPGRLYTGVASGELMVSENCGRSWQMLAADLPSIQSILCLEVPQ